MRNSIILIDCIELRIQDGLSLAKAVTEARAVCFHPMLRTARDMVAGGSVILADPIFQGFALSLMGSEIASRVASRMVVSFFVNAYQEACAWLMVVISR